MERTRLTIWHRVNTGRDPEAERGYIHISGDSKRSDPHVICTCKRRIGCIPSISEHRYQHLQFACWCSAIKHLGYESRERSDLSEMCLDESYWSLRREHQDDPFDSCHISYMSHAGQHSVRSAVLPLRCKDIVHFRPGYTST